MRNAVASERFYADIQRFNEMYRLPSNDAPTPLGPERVRHFQDILGEELREGDDLATRYERLLAERGELDRDGALDILTEMGDWLGDIIVYCASEARRWGLPLAPVLDTIMQSNFSKLGADGQPIYDARGKVMKGPDYWKPEPRIRELLSRNGEGT
jgi:predicted HAD superfamily Cof-like phosphohydrolase